jgi:hypothetical protein
MILLAENIEVKYENQDIFVLAVNEEDTLQMIKKNISYYTGYSSEEQVISVKLSNSMVQKSYSGYRNYYTAMSDSELDELYFIMKTLALKSLLELAKFKSKLEKAGDRIDHIHPLNFLAAIFTDEELKAYVHAIKKRDGMVWDKFISGLSNTLDEETKLNNVTMNFVQDFADRLGIDIQLIQQSVDNRKWSEFVKILIVNIPRNSDADRYDM